jgi:homoserine O-acetyltransferase
MPAPTDAEYFDLGDFTLQSGFTLRGARLAYKTYGTLNAEKTNVIVYPTWYSGWHTDNEWLIGADKALNPDEWFIIIPNMIGNGLSTSPSNAPAPYDRARFPAVTFYDQVEAQHRLVTEKFGISTIALVTGWSMGAGQTYQWAVSHPEMVQRAAPFCGSSKTAPHNQVFLESLIAALTADAAWADGDYSPDALPIKGLRAFARVYSGWGFSQAFYWEEAWRELGFTSLDDFLYGFWENFFRDGRDPNNLITMLGTWHSGNVGNTPGFGGDVEKALASIRCPLLAMPAEKDLYFPPEDEQWASQFIPHGEVRVIPGIWGHFAGGGPNPVDTAFIDAGIRDLLAKPGYSPSR